MGIAERKERDFKRRERDILQAALRLFDDEGWQLVTIERIAQEAEIGKGTVYLHFPSKEDIYGRLALDFFRQLLARLQHIDSALPVLERLRAAIAIVFEAHRREYAATSASSITATARTSGGVSTAPPVRSCSASTVRSRR